MCDGENKHSFCMNLERNKVRELIEKGLPNRNWSGFRPWPDWIKSRSLFEMLQNFVDSFDELVAPTRTPLVIPESSRTHFCASLRMEFDAHDGQQVRSEFHHVWWSTEPATRALLEHRPIDEEVHQPRRPPRLRPFPRDSTAVPLRHGRVLLATTGAPPQADRPSTSSSV